MFIKRSHEFIQTLAVFLAVAPLTISGCSSPEQTWQGIIQNINSADNTITIRMDAAEAKDFRLDPETEVLINGSLRNSAYLEPGLAVNVLINGKTAALIEVNLAGVDATLVSVSSEKVAIQPLGSNQMIQLRTRPFSVVRQLNKETTLDKLNLGRVVEVYYCTASSTAFEINEMPEDYTVDKPMEGSRIEGVVTRLRLSVLTVSPIGGLPRSVGIDNSTTIKFEDQSTADVNDIFIGDWVTVYFNRSTATATQVIIKPESAQRQNSRVGP
jgi:hypothetical protein